MLSPIAKFRALLDALMGKKGPINQEVGFGKRNTADHDADVGFQYPHEMHQKRRLARTVVTDKPDRFILEDG